MLKIFRNIRQKLIASPPIPTSGSTGRMGKYFIYATGEIILVVIGILIALAINNHYQYKKERKVETSILKKFAYDIDQDSLTLANLIQREERIKSDIDSVSLMLSNRDESDILKVFQKSQAVGSSSIFIPNTGTHDEAVATGTLQTILNDSLRSEVFIYYKLVINNINDKITDGYQTREIVPVLVDILATSQLSAKFILDYENPNLKQLTVSSLYENPDFHKILVWRKANSDILIENWKRFQEENERLKQMIAKEMQ